MLKLNVVLLTTTLLTLCDLSSSAAVVDKVGKKCAFGDSECYVTLFGSLMREVADNGIPEMDIPKIDPYEIKNMDIVLLGMLKITVTDGVVKGIKNCKSISYKTDTEKLLSTVELLCDVFSIEGKYKIEPMPTLLALLGGIKVYGEGNGGVIIEKLKLNLEFPYEIRKLADGELYFKIKEEETTYTFEILGKATLSADNIFVGSQEISTVVVNIANENWEFLTKTFGKLILDKAMSVFFKYVEKFFDTVPIKEIISNDVSAYVKS